MNRQPICSFVVAILCALLTTHPNAARAEDEDATNRAQAIDAINNELKMMATQLGRSRDEDTDDSIQLAIRQTDGMASNIDFLKGVKGNDSMANAILDHYPAYIDSFVIAAEALAKLKNAQVRQNEKMLWKRCAEADSTKHQVHDELARQIDEVNDISHAHDVAQNFSVSDAGWSNVTRRMHDAADGIWTIYDTQLKNTREKCSPSK